MFPIPNPRYSVSGEEVPSSGKNRRAALEKKLYEMLHILDHPNGRQLEPGSVESSEMEPAHVHVPSVAPSPATNAEAQVSNP